MPNVSPLSKLMFFTNISHDLRTPLTLIAEPVAQLAGADNLTPQQHFETEKNASYNGTKFGQYYEDAHYTPGKNEFYPIPYNQLYYVPGLYVQNKGYN